MAASLSRVRVGAERRQVRGRREGGGGGKGEERGRRLQLRGKCLNAREEKIVEELNGI